jgi:hypothetical protein
MIIDVLILKTSIMMANKPHLNKDFVKKCKTQQHNPQQVKFFENDNNQTDNVK